MEGLPFDFGLEESSEDDDKDKAKKKADKFHLPLTEQPQEKTSFEIFKSKDNQPEEEPEPVEPQERAEYIPSEIIDTAPELDAEAPLEDLSQVEYAAVAHTMATERLNEIQEKEPEPSEEVAAAESFLENVQSSGDLSEAYDQTLVELGVSRQEAEEIALTATAENSPPIDTSSLVEAARQEIQPLTRERPESIPTPNPETPSYNLPRPERPKTIIKNERVHKGIVDYLVGRRQARLVEKDQKPQLKVQLTQEIDQLRVDLLQREDRIREIALNKKVDQLPQVAKPESSSPSHLKKESASKIETRPKNSKSPIEKPKSGKVKAEVAGISAFTMKEPEVLKVAEAIELPTSNLRDLYDRSLLGEQGLRRVVAEYLRGGDYEKALQKEMVEREKDFERDPKLRDQGTSASVAPYQSNLDQLLQKTGIDWNEPQPFMKQPSVKANNLPAMVNNLKSSVSPARKIVDFILMGAIIVMAIVIIVLIISR